MVWCCRYLGHIRMSHISSVELPEFPKINRRGWLRPAVCANSQNRTHALSCSLLVLHKMLNPLSSKVKLFVVMCVIYYFTQEQREGKLGNMALNHKTELLWLQNNHPFAKITSFHINVSQFLLQLSHKLSVYQSTSKWTVKIIKKER